jgi:hypothetical protein
LIWREFAACINQEKFDGLWQLHTPICVSFSLHIAATDHHAEILRKYSEAVNAYIQTEFAMLIIEMLRFATV